MAWVKWQVILKSLQLQKLSHKDLLLLFILGLVCEVDTQRFVHEAQTYPNAHKIEVLPWYASFYNAKKKFFSEELVLKIAEKIGIDDEL